MWRLIAVMTTALARIILHPSYFCKKIFYSVFQMTDLVVHFKGQLTLVPGVTRFTTCDDVKEMMLYRSTENSQCYSLYESRHGAVRQLYGKESVLKIIRSWGANKKKFQLHLRKTDNAIAIVPSASQVKQKTQKMRMLSRADSVVSKSEAIRNNLEKGHVKKFKSKVIETAPTANRIRRNRGKMDLMKRFLHDVMSQKENQTRIDPLSRSLLRTPADGNGDASKSGDGIVDAHKEDIVNFVSDPESAFEDDSASECSSVCDLERNILEHDMESVSDDCSADRPCGDFDNTVLKTERIRKLFSGSDIACSGPDSEDADMESFMKTIICESDSDEGRGSSDF